MKVNAFHLQVLKGEKCPYCKSATKVVPANVYYEMLVGVDFIVACRKCDAYTHAYPNDTKPQGRLMAKNHIRKRFKALEQFNRLTVQNSFISEQEAYKELSEYLATPLEWTGICYLNAENCIRAETWCIKKYWHYQYKLTGRFVVPMTSRDGKRKKITVIEQVDQYNSVVEFEEDGKRMCIASKSIFFYKPK